MKWTKWTKWVGGCLAALVLTAGCGGPEPTAPTNAPQGELVVYTSQPEKDIQQLIEAYHEVHPEVNVKTFRSGTEEVISKVMAEKKVGAVQADVLLVADVSTFEGLKEEGLLAPYESPELAAIDPAYYDAGHTYVGTKAMATGLITRGRCQAGWPLQRWRERWASSASRGESEPPKTTTFSRNFWTPAPEPVAL